MTNQKPKLIFFTPNIEQFIEILKNKNIDEVGMVALIRNSIERIVVDEKTIPVQVATVCFIASSYEIMDDRIIIYKYKLIADKIPQFELENNLKKYRDAFEKFMEVFRKEGFKVVEGEWR